jgi:hypothetical protein
MEIINIPIQTLKKEGLTPNEYSILYLIRLRQDGIFRYLLNDENFSQDVHNLIQMGYLVSIGEGDMSSRTLAIHPSHVKLFSNPQSDIKDWIDEYRELFPKGINSSGYAYRGSKQGCLAKMVKFIKQTEYEKDIILKATAEYVANKKKDNYEYMMLADNFIYKNNASTLESYCELVTNTDYKPTISQDNIVDI